MLAPVATAFLCSPRVFSKTRRLRSLAWGQNDSMPELRVSLVPPGESRRLDPIQSPPSWDFFVPGAAWYNPITQGRESLAYRSFFALDQVAVSVLGVAIEHWVDSDLDLYEALQWATSYSAAIRQLLEARWDAGRLSELGGYVVTATFPDGSFATARVRESLTPRSSESSLTVDLYLSTRQLLAAQSEENQAALDTVASKLAL